jgi:hypothetical protein
LISDAQAAFAALAGDAELWRTRVKAPLRRFPNFR